MVAARKIRKKAAYKYRSRNREYVNEYIRKHKHRQKEIVFNHYGNSCACCGEKEEKFLTIDHINNDGNIHRKTIGGGFGIRRYIILNNFPKTFQILCMNCNFGKQQNKGICPHKNQ